MPISTKKPVLKIKLPNHNNNVQEFIKEATSRKAIWIFLGLTEVLHQSLKIFGFLFRGDNGGPQLPNTRRCQSTFKTDPQITWKKQGKCLQENNKVRPIKDGVIRYQNTFMHTAFGQSTEQNSTRLVEIGMQPAIIVILFWEECISLLTWCTHSSDITWCIAPCEFNQWLKSVSRKLI